MSYGHAEPLRTDPWHCPRCGTTDRPDERPNGTFCSRCREKLISCCEGAALPERTD